MTRWPSSARSTRCIRQVEHAFPDLTIIVRGDRVAIVSHSKSIRIAGLSRRRRHRIRLSRPRTAPRWTPTPCAAHARPERAAQQWSAPNTSRTRPRGARSCAGRACASVQRVPREETADGEASHARRHHLRARASRCVPRPPGRSPTSTPSTSHTITFAIGPAGTGKTYLAVAKAVRAFQDRQVRRIILTRPAVEAGEKPRLPARHAQREGRPLSAPAVRRAVRHARRRPAASATSTTAPSRSRRSPTCAAARSTTRS